MTEISNADCPVCNPHYETVFAARAKQIIDALPPKAWDVTVWDERSNYQRGRLDAAGRTRIVAQVLAVLEGEELDDDPSKYGSRPSESED